MTHPNPNLEQELINILKELDDQIAQRIREHIHSCINQLKQEVSGNIEELQREIAEHEKELRKQQEINQSIRQRLTALENQPSSKKQSGKKAEDNTTTTKSIDRGQPYDQFVEALKLHAEKQSELSKNYDEICEHFRSKYPVIHQETDYNKLFALLYLIQHQPLNKKNEIAESVTNFGVNIKYSYRLDNQYDLLLTVAKQFQPIMNNYQQHLQKHVENLSEVACNKSITPNS